MGLLDQGRAATLAAMRHTVTVALLLCCLVAPLASAAEPQKPRQKWEYAVLFTAKTITIWTTPNESVSSVEVDSKLAFFNVYKQVGGKLPIEKFSVACFLNLVGDQGWELISHQGVVGPEQYCFKRPKA